MEDIHSHLNDSSAESEVESSGTAKSKLWLVILIGALILGLIVVAIVFLSKADLATTFYYLHGVRIHRDWSCACCFGGANCYDDQPYSN
jgi:hypothetical protein